MAKSSMISRSTAVIRRISASSELSKRAARSGFGSNPASTSGSSSSDWSSAAAAASADNIVNGSKTAGAPQQSVVNGWYQNELSVIQTSQNTFLAASSARNGGLLGLLVLAVVGELIIRAFERKPTQLAVLPDTREVSNAV